MTSTTSATVSTVAIDRTTSTIAPDASSTSTTTVAGAASTTTTTNAVATTTTAPPASETKSYPIFFSGDGQIGEVFIVISGESVSFGSARPIGPWTVGLESAGPPEVEVHFEYNDEEEEEIEFHAKFEDGQLVVTVS